MRHSEWVIRGKTVEMSLFIMTAETGLVGKGCVLPHRGGNTVLDQGSPSG